MLYNLREFEPRFTCLMFCHVSVGTDLLQVAAHEIGHVLGLQHSLELGAVMSPFYSFSYPLQLSVDDKRGIQSLYGAKRMETKEETNEIPPEAPDTNEVEITVVRIWYYSCFRPKTRFPRVLEVFEVCESIKTISRLWKVWENNTALPSP